MDCSEECRAGGGVRPTSAVLVWLVGTDGMVGDHVIGGREA